METPAKKTKILIVDDDKFLSDMYALKFKEHSFDISTANSGADALAKIAGGAVPDCILLDIVMPTMDGFEFLAEMKKRGIAPAAKVVILSNLGQQEDVDKGLKLGVAGYIVKASCTPSEVLAKVEALIKK